MWDALLKVPRKNENKNKRIPCVAVDDKGERYARGFSAFGFNGSSFTRPRTSRRVFFISVLSSSSLPTQYREKRVNELPRIFIFIFSRGYSTTFGIIGRAILSSRRPDCIKTVETITHARAETACQLDSIYSHFCGHKKKIMENGKTIREGWTESCGKKLDTNTREGP